MRSLSRALPLLVAGCFFMENLDATIVITAVPSIAKDLGVTAASVGVTITAYVMTVAVLIPLSGWLAGRFGVRRLLLVSIATFTIASAACALSPDLLLLVLARILQGVGGAMMVPVGRLTVLRATEKKELVRTVAVLTWPALAAPIIAPLLGGLLTTALSWHWIFLVNLPLGVAGLVVGARILPRRDPDDARGTVRAAPDWVGLGLTCVGIGCVVGAAALVTAARIDVLLVIVLAAGGAVLLAFAIRHLLRAPNPFIDLRLLRTRSFGVAVGGGSVYRLAISAIPFVVPLLLQRAFGWSPVEAGAAVLLLFAGNLGIKPTTTWMLNAAGFRGVMIGSHLVGAACLVAIAFFRETTPIALILTVFVISGAARSTGFTAYNTITYAEVEPVDMTGANVLDATVQQLAVGFGVALSAISIAFAHILGPAAQATNALPYDITLAALALVLLVSTIPAWRLPISAGAELVRQHRPA